jgi:hypothetical protein
MKGDDNRFLLLWKQEEEEKKRGKETYKRLKCKTDYMNTRKIQRKEWNK